MEKHLGKITSAEFGLCGYQEAMIGLNVSFSYGGGYASGSCKATWDPTLIAHTASSQWTEADRDHDFARIIREVSNLLADAGVKSVSDLKGKPVEVTVEKGILTSWRILKEVI